MTRGNAATAEVPSPVLVTGAGGFIGSHLVEQCVRRGMRVRAMVRYGSRNSWGWLDESPVRGDVEVVVGDVRDMDSVDRAIEGCRSVFHLAALIGIPYSYVSPLAYVRTNVEGTYNVLEAARRRGVERVVVTSTSETYGTAQRVPIDESHPVVAQSPYAATKAGADQLALSYGRSFGTPVHVVRPFNTFGPRQSPRAFIPSVIVQLLSGATSLRAGNLSPTRDLTYVDDTAAGFLAVASCPGLAGTVTNLGTGREVAMRDLAAALMRIVGRDVPIEHDSERARPADSEVERLVCDASRAREVAGWEPRVGLDEGLARTVEWFRGRTDACRPGVYTV